MEIILNVVNANKATACLMLMYQVPYTKDVFSHLKRSGIVRFTRIFKVIGNATNAPVQQTLASTSLFSMEYNQSDVLTQFLSTWVTARFITSR